MANLFVQVRFQQLTGLSKDVVENTWSFITPTPIGPVDTAEVHTALTAFYDSAITVPNLGAIGQYMSPCISRAVDAHEMRFYDVTTRLSGGPAGSPIRTLPFSLLTPSASGQPIPNQDACCLSFRTDPSVALDLPVAEQVPTQDFAVDIGAPATHAGFSRPLERRTGRVYLGPWNIQAVDIGAQNEPRVASTLRDLITAAARRFITSLATTVVWAVWSRAAGIMTPVVQAWVDDRWDAMRKRESAALVKTFMS